jgi:hypothetical protein
MKKIKIITISIIVLLLFIFFLSFLKLPINYLSPSKIKKDSEGLVNLISFDKQYLKLLPTPFLNIINSELEVNHQNIAFNLFLDELEASRSITNNSKISLNVNKGRIANVETNLFSNGGILDGTFEDLKISIQNNADYLEIKTNIFKYQNSSISFDSTFKDQQLYKIKFTLTNLNANQLILLLEPKLQAFFKNINIKSLDISGEFAQDLLLIENATLEIDGGGYVNLSGTFDLHNLLNSKISLNGNQIPSRVIENLFKNFSILDLITIPQGYIDVFQISFDEVIKIDKIDYLAGSNSNIILENFTSNLLFNEFSGDINLTNISKEQLSALNLISNFEILQKINFDNLTATLYVDQSQLKIHNLNINNDQDMSIDASGSLDLLSKQITSIALNVENFNDFDLFDNPQIKSAVQNLNPDYVNVQSIVYNDHIKLENLEVFKNQIPIANITGAINLNDFNKSIFNINLNQISKNITDNLIKNYTPQELHSYLNLIEYNFIESELIADIENSKFIIKDLILNQNDISSSINGEVEGNKFKGSLDLKNINLSKLDELHLGTSRIDGRINILLNIPNFSNSKDFSELSGNIQGDINFDILQEELALIFFMQTLAKDIEDFEQLNELLFKLTNSYINKQNIISGEIENTKKNIFHIKNLTLKSPDGEVLNGDFIYQDKNFELKIFDVVGNDDFIISYQNGSYSYERVTAEGDITKPIEELIQNNLNQLLQNLLQ